MADESAKFAAFNTLMCDFFVDYVAKLIEHNRIFDFVTAR